jgi:phosphohistidine phosphatase
MKTLLLMRHAKSSWKDQELSDHERPLNKRGRKDAPRMGQLLCDRELIPQRILCSSALRAKQTAEALVEAAGNQAELMVLDRLYLAEADEYISVLREQPDHLERLMVIGHNPGLETLLQMLSGRIESLPTAVIAHLVLPIQHWTELSGETKGEMIEIWKPKEIEEERVPESGQDFAGKSAKKEKKKAKEKSSKKDN